MSMLPIFMIGLIVGIVLSYAYYICRQDMPSNVKIRTQEREIERQKSDNKLLINLNEKLYKKINELETELNEFKK